MARQAKQSKQTRKQYSLEYKAEALKLAERVGAATAAKQLGLQKSHIYAWRGKAKREQGQSDTERQLATENARLKRQLAEQAEELAILKKATAYFAKNLK